MDARLSTVGVNTPQLATLLAVTHDPGISNASLARSAFVTPQSMQGRPANLERAGLISRIPHPQHGPIIQTALTPAGIEAMRAGIAVADEVEQTMLSALNDQEARQLSELPGRCALAMGWSEGRNREDDVAT